MKSLKRDEADNIRESMVYEESTDLLNEKYGDVDSPSRCRNCGAIILNEENERIMRSEDYEDLCECAVKMENRFIKASELREMLNVKELRMGRYGVFVDE